MSRCVLAVIGLAGALVGVTVFTAYGVWKLTTDVDNWGPDHEPEPTLSALPRRWTR